MPLAIAHVANEIAHAGGVEFLAHFELLQFVPAEKVEVIDTVGAGDTFSGGLLTGLREAGVVTKDAAQNLTAEQIEAGMRLGARAAAVTVSRAGANPPTRVEL